MEIWAVELIQDVILPSSCAQTKLHACRPSQTDDIQQDIELLMKDYTKQRSFLLSFFRQH